jgi:hypothetical protein
MVRTKGDRIMEYLFIYLLQITEIIKAVNVILLSVVIIAAVTVFVLKAHLLECGKTDASIEKVIKSMKNLIIRCLIVVLIDVSIPTKQTLLLMGGTYMGKQAVNSVVTSDKMQKVNEIIDLQLDKDIKDLKENK